MRHPAHYCLAEARGGNTQHLRDGEDWGKESSRCCDGGRAASTRMSTRHAWRRAPQTTCDTLPRADDRLLFSGSEDAKMDALALLRSASEALAHECCLHDFAEAG